MAIRICVIDADNSTAWTFDSSPNAELVLSVEGTEHVLWQEQHDKSVSCQYRTNEFLRDKVTMSIKVRWSIEDHRSTYLAAFSPCAVDGAELPRRIPTLGVHVWL